MKVKTLVTASLIIILLISSMIIYLGIFADPKFTESVANWWQPTKIKEEQINVTIENLTIVKVENNTTTIPSCTNSDWTSFKSPGVCPSTGKQTRTWQKLSNCSGGVSHPSSEIISCNYVPPVTRAS